VRSRVVLRRRSTVTGWSLFRMTRAVAIIFWLVFIPIGTVLMLWSMKLIEHPLFFLIKLLLIAEVFYILLINIIFGIIANMPLSS
jgi:hypothetical protein